MGLGCRDSRLWLVGGRWGWDAWNWYNNRLLTSRCPLPILGAAAYARPSRLTSSICDRTLPAPICLIPSSPLTPYLYLNILAIWWDGETQNSKMCVRPTNAHEAIVQNKIMSLFLKRLQPLCNWFWKLCYARFNFIKLLTAHTYLIQRFMVCSLVHLCDTARLCSRIGYKHGYDIRFLDSINLLTWVHNVLKDKFKQCNSVYIQRWKRVIFVTALSMCLAYDEKYANTNIKWYIYMTKELNIPKCK